jgi:two-component system, chemotaxis family, chemotaxis protein CheY
MLKVLIVDDYSTMRRIVRNLLNQIGITDPDEADTGQSALEKLRSSRFDVVIADWTMQPMSGLDLLKAIRADHRLKDTRFIIVTADHKAENIIAAKEAGVNNYIVKPFDASTLKKRLEAVVGMF